MEIFKNKEDYNTFLYLVIALIGLIILGLSIYPFTQINMKKAPIIIRSGWNIFLNIGACVMTAGFYVWQCNAYNIGCLHDQKFVGIFWVFLAISITMIIVSGMMLHEYLNGNTKEYEYSDSKNKELTATMVAIGCVMFILSISGISQDINKRHKGIVI
jgi:uncharacterized membrane protein